MHPAYKWVKVDVEEIMHMRKRSIWNKGVQMLTPKRLTEVFLLMPAHDGQNKIHKLYNPSEPITGQTGFEWFIGRFDHHPKITDWP